MRTFWPRAASRLRKQELVERFCGMSDPEMLAVIECEWGRALPALYGERVRALIEKEFRQSLRAIEGVADARLAANAHLRRIEQRTGSDRPKARAHWSGRTFR